MSDTPRTDAEEYERLGAMTIDPDFARQLERELQAAQAALAQVHLDKAEYDALKARLARYETAAKELPEEPITGFVLPWRDYADALRDALVACKVENERICRLHEGMMKTADERIDQVEADFAAARAQEREIKILVEDFQNPCFGPAIHNEIPRKIGLIVIRKLTDAPEQNAAGETGAHKESNRLNAETMIIQSDGRLTLKMRGNGEMGVTQPVVNLEVGSPVHFFEKHINGGASPSVLAEQSFEREWRYIVLKRKDVEKHLMRRERDTLYALAKSVDVGRVSEGKRVMNCVVVEDDWPEYEPVWKMIEVRMSEPTTSSVLAALDLEAELAACRVERDEARKLWASSKDAIDTLKGKLSACQVELDQCRREKNDLVLKAYPAMDERDMLQVNYDELRRNYIAGIAAARAQERERSIGAVALAISLERRGKYVNAADAVDRSALTDAPEQNAAGREAVSAKTATQQEAITGLTPAPAAPDRSEPCNHTNFICYTCGRPVAAHTKQGE